MNIVFGLACDHVTLAIKFMNVVLPVSSLLLFLRTPLNQLINLCETLLGLLRLSSRGNRCGAVLVLFYYKYACNRQALYHILAFNPRNARGILQSNFYCSYFFFLGNFSVLLKNVNTFYSTRKKC